MGYIGNQDYNIIEANIGTVTGTDTAANIVALPNDNGALWIASDTGHLYLNDGFQWYDLGQLQCGTGPQGISVTGISKTLTNGLVDTYTVTFSDMSTTTYTITNGKGIVSVARTSGDGSEGTLDTYTITYNDSTTSTYDVYNGADGNTWLTGSTVPLAGDGSDGDLYLNTATNFYYEKVTGSWVLKGTLKGDAYSYNAAGTLVGRSAYDTEAAGFGYLSLDEAVPTVYFKLSSAPGDWSIGTAVGKGVGISNVTKTGTLDNVDTYTITYDDLSTNTFTVTNANIDDSQITTTNTWSAEKIVLALDDAAAVVAATNESINDLIQSIVDLSTAAAQSQFGETFTSPGLALSTSEVVLPFTTIVQSTDTNKFSLNDTAETISIKDVGVYQFLSTMTFENIDGSSQATSVTFSLRDTANNILYTETKAIETGAGNKISQSFNSLFEVTQSMLDSHSGEIEFDINVVADNSYYRIVEFNSILSTSGATIPIVQPLAPNYTGVMATIASASTTNVGAATADYLNVTGTTTITAFDTIAAGVERTIVFDGALTLTHNATRLILPTGANITTVAGDTAIFRSEGSGNWRLVGGTVYTRIVSGSIEDATDRIGLIDYGYVEKSYHIVAFGGEFNRADYPKLWAYLQENPTLVKTQAQWQTEATANDGICGFYSSGNETTTFRVPNLDKAFLRPDNRGVGSYQRDDFKSHQHINYTATNSGSGTSERKLASSPGFMDIPTSPTGGIETRPRNIAVLPLIVAK